MPDRPRNLGASVRQRLLNLAHARGQPMELLLTRYALERLLQAIVATFARRNTVVPVVVPAGLSDAFATDPGKQRQWHAFARNLSGPELGFGLVVSELRSRLASF